MLLQRVYLIRKAVSLRSNVKMISLEYQCKTKCRIFKVTRIWLSSLKHFFKLFHSKQRDRATGLQAMKIENGVKKGRGIRKTVEVASDATFNF